MRIFGVDFTCAPRPAKPIVVSVCRFRKNVLEIEAIEKHPGLLARSILGRASYKNDAKAKQTPERREARIRLVSALRVKTNQKIKSHLIDDATGDSLDAVLCAIQAAGAIRRRGFGVPAGIGCEGWIVSA